MASTSAPDSKTEAESICINFVIREGNLNQPRKNSGKLRNCSFGTNKIAKRWNVEWGKRSNDTKARGYTIFSGSQIYTEKFAEKEDECFSLTEELSHAKERLSHAQQKLDENQRTIASNYQVSFPIQTMYKPYGDYNQLFSNLFISLFLMLV